MRECTVRTMRRDEVDLAIDLAAGEGWNPGLHDAHCFAAPDTVALACMMGARLAGWGVIRRCREGYKIGPLVADAKDVAASLYAALCSCVPEGAAIYLDVPLPNAAAVALAESHGMQVVFETARMYTGAPPACELERVFGITSFELG